MNDHNFEDQTKSKSKGDCSNTFTFTTTNNLHVTKEKTFNFAKTI